MKIDLAALEKKRREERAKKNRDEETEQANTASKNDNGDDTESINHASHRQKNIVRMRRVFGKEGGLGRKSIFWDPLVNPFGVAPKGYKNVEWDDIKQETKKKVNNSSAEDWIKNIPLPLGLKPGVDVTSDEEREYEKKQAEEQVQVTEYSSAPKLRDFVKEATANLIPAALMRSRAQKNPMTIQQGGYLRSTNAIKLAEAQLRNKTEEENVPVIGPAPPSTDNVETGDSISSIVGPVGPAFDDVYSNEDGYGDDQYYDEEGYYDNEENVQHENHDISHSVYQTNTTDEHAFLQQNVVGPKQPTLEDYGSGDYSEEEYPDTYLAKPVINAYERTTHNVHQSYVGQDNIHDENNEHHDEGGIKNMEDAQESDDDEYDEFGNYKGQAHDEYDESSNMAPEEYEYRQSQGSKRKYEEDVI